MALYLEARTCGSFGGPSFAEFWHYKDLKDIGTPKQEPLKLDRLLLPNSFNEIHYCPHCSMKQYIALVQSIPCICLMFWITSGSSKMIYLDQSVNFVSYLYGSGQKALEPAFIYCSFPEFFTLSSFVAPEDCFYFLIFRSPVFSNSTNSQHHYMQALYIISKSWIFISLLLNLSCVFWGPTVQRNLGMVVLSWKTLMCFKLFKLSEWFHSFKHLHFLSFLNGRPLPSWLNTTTVWSNPEDLVQTSSSPCFIGLEVVRILNTTKVLPFSLQEFQ